MDRDAYRVELPAVEHPFRVTRWPWIVLALVVGAIAGQLATLPRFALRDAAFNIVLAVFGVFAFARPVVAVQILLFGVVSGMANFVQGDVAGTVYRGGDLLVAALVGTWLITGRGFRALRTRRFAGWMFGLIVLWLGFGLHGVLAGHPWVWEQKDVVPGLYLLTFFPIVDVLEDDRAIRGVLRAIVLGLAVMAGGLLYEYITHLNSDPGIFSSSWGQIYGSQGFADGPRVTPFAGSWLPAGMLAGLVLMQRRSREARSAFAPFLFAGAMGFAVLVVYTRSLIAAAVLAAILVGLLLAREPRRAVSMAATVAGLAALLWVTVPLIGGQSAAGAFEDLRLRFTNISQDQNWIDRGHETRAGMKVFGEQPFFGAGFGVVVSVPELEDGRRPPSNYFDNAWAGMLAKTGVVGTGYFAVFLLMLVWRSVRQALRAPGPQARVLVAGGTWLLGLMIASYSSPFIVEVPGILFVATLAAFTAAFEGRSPSRTGEETRSDLLAALELEQGDPRVPADLWEAP
ncbi:MAG: O-antigen ligase family protein [Actinomycetota bacterium]